MREALRRYGLEEQEREHRAAYLWAEVVGPGINRCTVRRYVVHGVLHVYISSASLRQELRHHIPALITSINDAVGEPTITQIELH